MNCCHKPTQYFQWLNVDGQFGSQAGCLSTFRQEFPIEPSGTNKQSRLLPNWTPPAHWGEGGGGGGCGCGVCVCCRFRSGETSAESENDDDRESRKREAVGVYIGAVDFPIKPTAVV